jgi:hypothetical protein
MSNSKSVYTEPLVKVISAGDLAEEEKRRKQEERNKKFFYLGTGVAATAVAAYGIRTSSTLQNALAGDDRLSLLRQSLQATSLGSYFDLKSTPNVTFSDGVLNAMRMAEEYSPFKILRTFDMSHFMTPFTIGDNFDYKMAGENVAIQSPYLQALFQEQGEMLSDNHKKRGLHLRNGDVFEINENGSTGRKILSEVRMVATHYDLPGTEDGTPFRNHTLRKFADIYDVDTNFDFDRVRSGGEDELSFITNDKTKWMRAYGRGRFERPMRVLDDPADALIDYFGDNEISRWARQKLHLGFGTRGDYSNSVPRMLQMSLGNMAKGTLLMGAAFYAADASLRAAAPDDSAYSKGIIPGVLTSMVNAEIGYAEGVSDHFQGYKDTQEYIAPGSTSLITLAGLPLVGAMHGGTASYGARLWQSAHSIEAGAEAADEAISLLPTNRLSGIFNPQLRRNTRWAGRGALAGLALALPFIPGALIGESSDELKAVYSGDKDIAVKSNRWWFSGGTEYEGEKTKYFTKHSYVRMMAEAETKSLYGDQETKDKMNPFLNPFDYLRNPYQFEEMHQEDRPYSVWGMDVSYGTFFGKAFEKTIGQLIKPDMINPKLSGQMSDSPGVLAPAINSELTPAKGRELLTKAMGSKEFNFTIPVSDNDASLIADGLMMAPPSAGYNPMQEGASWSWGAFKDFMGLTGFTMGIFEDDMSLDMQGIGPQLARSGEATNAARKFKDMNVGGAFGLTEAQRRFLPTSSGSIYERVNPLKNDMPSWLPGDNDAHFLNLQTGDPYTQVENGLYRLPGAGYEALHPILEGYDKEDYPDIFKFKILSDIAMGSDAYYDAKNRIETRRDDGTLTDHEQGMLSTITDQELQRSKKKRFNEYRTDAEMQGVGMLGKAVNSYWETVTHNAETPAEFLTFFRPGGKMIHQRTAIEDYEKTQVYGSDLAMWDRPVDHFIKPAINKTAYLINGATDNEPYIPADTEDRRAIDEYFDNLEYVKQRRVYKAAIASGDSAGARTAQSAYQKTTVGAVASEIDTEKDLLRSYISLSAEEKPYFSSFINAEGEDRSKISSLLPGNLDAIYQTVWNRKDAMATAESRGISAEEAIQRQVDAENDELIRQNQGEYSEYNKNRSGSFKEHMMDNQAEAYIAKTTGTPDENFIGWDPRIDTQDIKLRAISLGDEDMHDFGFWESDTERLSRLISVMNEQQVVTQIADIKKRKKQEQNLKDNVATVLYNQGYEVGKVDVNPSGSNSMTINAETQQ